jgi:chromosomal replication initiator protein
VLQDLGPSAVALPITPGRILAATAAAFDVTITELESPSRRQPLARARQVAMYLCRQLTDLSLPKIGQLFGSRDHTTVMHGVSTVHRLIQTDRALFDQVTALLQSLRTP